MSRRPIDLVLPLARQIYQRFEDGRGWSFAHASIAMEAQDVLAMVRDTGAGSVLLHDGELMNDVDRPWYGPVEAVFADRSELQAAAVRASIWESWPGMDETAADLSIRLTYGRGPRADQVISLNVGTVRPARLQRSVYDHQRADQGYEGENRVSVDPVESDIEAFVAMVDGLPLVPLARLDP